MATSARLLSVLALTLAVSACAGDDKTPAKSEDAAKPAAADAGSKGDAPIAGTPVEGEGKVATADGGGAEDKEYNLEIDTVEAKVGEESKVSVRIVPQGVWHMNLDYPTKLVITPPDGTTVAKPTLAKADAVKLDEASCEFAVAFTPTDAGSKKFTGEFKFAVCKDEACVPRTEKVEFEVAVK